MRIITFSYPLGKLLLASLGFLYFIRVFCTDAKIKIMLRFIGSARHKPRNTMRRDDALQVRLPDFPIVVDRYTYSVTASSIISSLILKYCVPSSGHTKSSPSRAPALLIQPIRRAGVPAISA